ncbi:hypothetical protein F2Q68_00012467 [Brassica cretica]|uniref:Uncharacterized protein n=1 Tax=Brassica cretica TaxID=69181 RepID=A0A8S9KWU2_BRACR|nr:hypothetical protein F2Q68_00012467 [Brassica cretica]
MIHKVKGVKLESEEEVVGEKGDKSWLRVSLASQKLRENISASPMKGLYYCVIYPRPGDYHQIYSPADWNALVRRHFAGRTREIWKQGFMALAAVGATNIGSIELSIEPELRTHEPKKKLFHAASLIVWKKTLSQSSSSLVHPRVHFSVADSAPFAAVLASVSERPSDLCIYINMDQDGFNKIVETGRFLSLILWKKALVRFPTEPPEERVYDPHGQGVMLESEEEVVGEKGDKSWFGYSLISHLSRLFPVNEHAMRTIKNLYVENERVVLEEIWKHGFMALAAVGATNIGSIELSIEPELRTHEPKKKLFPAASLIVWKKALVPNLGSNTV